MHRVGLWGLAAVLALATVLVVALSLGWNNPRPSGDADWTAPGLPRAVTAPVETTTIQLLGHPGLSPETNRPGFILEGIAAAQSGPVFNGYGFAFCAEDESHYSVFALGSDGYYAILRVDANEETELVSWQQFPHIQRGRQANRLRIECEATVCEFYINDEYATTVAEDSWGDGDFGLWVRSFERQAVEAVFTTMGVWTRPASNG
jgi:hypothetical protein